MSGVNYIRITASDALGNPVVSRVVEDAELNATYPLYVEGKGVHVITVLVRDIDEDGSARVDQAAVDRAEKQTGCTGCDVCGAYPCQGGCLLERPKLKKTGPLRHVCNDEDACRKKFEAST